MLPRSHTVFPSSAPSSGRVISRSDNIYGGASERGSVPRNGGSGSNTRSDGAVHAPEKTSVQHRLASSRRQPESQPTNEHRGLGGNLPPIGYEVMARRQQALSRNQTPTGHQTTHGNPAQAGYQTTAEWHHATNSHETLDGNQTSIGHQSPNRNQALIEHQALPGHQTTHRHQTLSRNQTPNEQQTPIEDQTVLGYQALNENQTPSRDQSPVESQLPIEYEAPTSHQPRNKSKTTDAHQTQSGNNTSSSNETPSVEQPNRGTHPSGRSNSRLPKPCAAKATGERGTSPDNLAAKNTQSQQAADRIGFEEMRTEKGWAAICQSTDNSTTLEKKTLQAVLRDKELLEAALAHLAATCTTHYSSAARSGEEQTGSNDSSKTLAETIVEFKQLGRQIADFEQLAQQIAEFKLLGEKIAEFKQLEEPIAEFKSQGWKVEQLKEIGWKRINELKKLGNNDE